MSAPDAATLYRVCQDLIRSGQPVFPCKAKGEKAKAPLTRNGWKDASLDRAVVKDWWRRYRSAAIGIPTGIVWDVLDVDVKNASDGRLHLPYLTRLGLLNGCKRVVRTPSGGWHLYFTASKVTNKANAHLGLDMRGRGGYVVAPPSFLETPDYTGPYEEHEPPLDSTNEPLRWDLIVSALAPKDESTNQDIELLGYERQSSLASLRGWLAEREPGERNNSLHWAVCRCIDNNIDPRELLEVALHIGLPEDEALLTINSALKRAGLSADDLDTEAEAMFGKD